MFALQGTVFDFQIADDDKITITHKKKNKNVVIQDVSFFKVLYYNSKSILGVGQIILYAQGHKKPIVESFNKNQKADFDRFFEYLSTKCEYLNLSYWQACSYAERKKQNGKTEHATIMNTKRPRWNAKKQVETQCTCGRCQTTWYVNDQQKMRMIGNLMGGIGSMLSGQSEMGAYYVNNVHDVFQCPHCGSKMIKKHQVIFWVDKQGNYIE